MITEMTIMIGMKMETVHSPKKTDHGDVPSDSETGKSKLVTGETGECQRPPGKNFSPPREEQNKEYS
ncbi:hypothetical protein [Methanospirillum sp.]|jgi:hypothetical protein